PTGTVTFLDAGNAIGSGILGGGAATFSTSALAAGSHTITASYAGDGNFNGTTGSMIGNPQAILILPAIQNLFGASTIAQNSITSLTFTIQNPNATGTLTGIAFTDNLPPGLLVASNLNNLCGGTATAVGGSSLVSLSGVSLAANTICTVSVNVQ